MSVRLFAATLALISIPLQLSAQPESYVRPGGANHGPHAGKVIGRGAVLAEVVWRGGATAEVHFLNDQWVSLRARPAKVEALLSTQASPKGAPVECKAGKFDEFVCTFPNYKQIRPGDRLLISRFVKPTDKPSDFEFIFPKAPTQ